MRNNSVDMFRLIASFAVVLLHVKYGSLPLAAVENIRLLGRFGVPFFFMVSGYFFFENYVKNGDKAFTKTLQRLVGIFLIASLSYGILKFHRFTFNYLLLFEGTNLHLWFLSSMVFGLIICWYHYAYLKATAVMVIISVVIIMLSLVSDAYAFLIPFKIDAGLSRYLLSVPYLFAGMLVAQKQFRLSNAASIALVAAGIILQAAESRYLFFAHGYNPYDLQFMAGTIPFSVGMFFLSFNTASNQALGGLGRKYSLSIYIYHPLVNYFLFTALRKLFGGAAGMVFMFSPLISFGTTLLLLMAIDRFLPALFAVLNGELNRLTGLHFKKEKTAGIAIQQPTT